MTPAPFSAVVVGSGVAGAIVAKELGLRGFRVLVLEAGLESPMDDAGFRGHVRSYLAAPARGPNSAYPRNPNAPHPEPSDIPGENGYLVQRGPMPFSSVYTRYLGGTTLQWLGTSLRMLPSDFRLRSLYGRGVDWPLAYEDLAPFYARAEGELGVAGDAEEQAYLGVSFPDGYAYPMEPVPPSYSDALVAAGLEGMRFQIGDEVLPVQVSSTAQARNTRPDPRRDPGSAGPSSDPWARERCEGYASCVPICPVQAKYSALRTLRRAPPDRVEILTRTVASRLRVDPGTGRITGVVCKRYRSPSSPEHTVEVVGGTLVVLAAGAIENAKVLLASGLANSSDQVGRNLMDHPFPMSWGLLRERAGTFRGPGSTSGIETLRDGSFRRERAAFRIELSNWGWEFPTGAPQGDLTDLVDGEGLFGRGLRRALFDRVQRQLRFGFVVEQEPCATNRVTLDPAFRDALGEPRPVITYDLSGYVRAGIATARRFSEQAFARLGVEDCTVYAPGDPRHFLYEGAGYSWWGSGHSMGTHRMGGSARDSVVDADQRSWDHPNLYLVGAGSFPTAGTANPTLTLAALAFRSVERMARDLTGNGA
ncbi:MAG TPA: GMC family oxidoreductase [Myxococcaceae bacterium]|jgi:choline dehydrogenase-like flavoprotein